MLKSICAVLALGLALSFATGPAVSAEKKPPSAKSQKAPKKMSGGECRTKMRNEGFRGSSPAWAAAIKRCKKGEPI